MVACATWRTTERSGLIVNREAQMANLPTDTRLRAILSSWHNSRRYRPEGAEQHRNCPVRITGQTELNREFETERYSEWRWPLVALLAFMAIYVVDAGHNALFEFVF